MFPRLRPYVARVRIRVRSQEVHVCQYKTEPGIIDWEHRAQGTQVHSPLSF